MASFNDFLKKLFGSKADRDMKAIRPTLEKVLKEYSRIDILSDDQLREETDKLRAIINKKIAKELEDKKELRDKLANTSIDIKKKEEIATEIDRVNKKIDELTKEILDEVLPTAFAVMKSTARRFKENPTIKVKASEMDKEFSIKHSYVQIDGEYAIWKNTWNAGGNPIVWDMVHYDVQLIGGIVLHQGKISEMATGEGKTLVATLPVFLNALAGRGVHVVTVNDYLSKRDSEWMGPLYQFHGLRVDCIDKHQPNSDERKKAYLADITFGTNNEFGFDYLRDNMAIDVKDLVQTEHYYAIVDEVDSVLIDDARTPLIISGPVPKGEDQMFMEYKPPIERLYNLQKTLVREYFTKAKAMLEEAEKTGGSSDEGAENLFLAYKGLPSYTPLVKYLLDSKAQSILKGVEKNFIQSQSLGFGGKDKNIQKFKNLLIDNLYFVIEEQQKSVELTDKGHDLLSKAFGDKDENFFIIPNMGDDVSNIEKLEISDEEKQQMKDEVLADFSIKSERVHTINQLLKAYAMFEKDVEYVLMDNKIKIVDEQTGRILEGRRYSDGLHQAIEAKENVKVEAATQTFATITLQNYFRMYTKLAGMTGTAETEAGEFWSIYKLEVVVIPTNKQIIRKDNSDMVFMTKREKYDAVVKKIISLSEEGRPVLVGTTSVEVSELISRMLKMKGIKHNVLNAKQHAREAEIVATAGQTGVVTIATNMAGRGTDIKLSAEARAAGGLAIVGTERHDSRRVDRQLRGRAGRQGDPGSSTFYVSFEDDLMRLFGSYEVLKKFKLEEGEPMTHPMLTNAIERAQRKVEENNFGIRKRLLEYDDVMNQQRKVIYTKRKNALDGERIDIDMANMMSDYCDIITEKSKGVGFEQFNERVIRSISIAPNFDKDSFEKMSSEQISDHLYENLKKEYNRRSELLVKQAWPVIKNIYERQANVYENIAIPIIEGNKVLQVIVNLKKTYETEGREIAKGVSKTITLLMIDEYWKEHLREMDELKQSVQNAAYEQKDPLLVYKFESFNLFEGVLEKISKEVISYVMRAKLPIREDNDQTALSEGRRRRADLSNTTTSRSDLATNGGEPRSNAPVRVEKKVGRNDPCPCGSGKKYKNCHGRDAE